MTKEELEDVWDKPDEQVQQTKQLLQELRNKRAAIFNELAILTQHEQNNPQE